MSLNVPTNVTTSGVANRQISAAAAWLLYLSVQNTDSVARYVAIYDSASTPTSYDVPAIVLGPIASGATYVASEKDLGVNGMRFGKGIFLQVIAPAAAPTLSTSGGSAAQRVHAANVPHNAPAPTSVALNVATINAWVG